MDRKSLGRADYSQVTYDVVVLAAHGVGVALVASADTDDGDGRAVQADESVDGPEDDTEKGEEDRNDRVAGLRIQQQSVSGIYLRRWGQILTDWTWLQH